jgi:hypothetical protein
MNKEPQDKNTGLYCTLRPGFLLALLYNVVAQYVYYLPWYSETSWNCLHDTYLFPLFIFGESR